MSSETTTVDDTHDDPSALVPVGPVGAADALSMVPVDPAAVPALDHQVDAFVGQLLGTDPASPAFSDRVEDVRSMGADAIRAAADTSTRLLESPVRSLRRGPLSDAGKVATSLVELRRTVESLDPARASASRRVVARIPGSSRLAGFLHRNETSQAQLDAVVVALRDSQDELRRDNAALTHEKAQLWTGMQRLVQYAYLTGRLDAELSAQLAELEHSDPARATALRDDVLYEVRHKHQDLLTQLAVSVQGYLAVDLVRRNNVELVKGVDRATTTTVAALRTAMVVNQALANQRVVLDQVEALGATTAQLMESSSKMLATQSAEVHRRAADPAVSTESLRRALDDVYRSMDAIDQFKAQATAAMSDTVESLQATLAQAAPHVSRAGAHELASPAPTQ